MISANVRAAAGFFRTRALSAAMVLFLLGGGPAFGARRGEPELFREGSLRFSALFGSGTAFQETYSIFGAGAGYYVMDNVELGLDAEFWQASGPSLTRLSPQVMYVFPTGGSVRPYAGAFYRRTLIETYDDLNDAGGRGGALFLFGRQAYIGVGMVYERHLACDRLVFGSCAEIYPELLVAIIF